MKKTSTPGDVNILKSGVQSLTTDIWITDSPINLVADHDSFLSWQVARIKLDLSTFLSDLVERSGRLKALLNFKFSVYHKTY